MTCGTTPSPGTSPQQRRDALLQYLAHEGALANAGPASTAAARSVLGQTYVTFGNAAWAWDSAYGWTSVPLANDAGLRLGPGLRSPLVRAAAGEAVDRFGFAWSPSNTLGLSDCGFQHADGFAPRSHRRCDPGHERALRGRRLRGLRSSLVHDHPRRCRIRTAVAAVRDLVADGPRVHERAVLGDGRNAFRAGHRRAPDPRDGRQCGRRPDADARLRLPDRGLRARERRPVVADAHTDDSGRLGAMSRSSTPTRPPAHRR